MTARHGGLSNSSPCTQGMLWFIGYVGLYPAIDVTSAQDVPEALKRGIMGLPFDPDEDAPAPQPICAAYEALVYQHV